MSAEFVPVTEGVVSGERIDFEHRTLLRFGSRAFWIEASAFTPVESNFFNGLPYFGILKATGRWPERSWLLVERDEPCQDPAPNVVLGWTGARWQETAARDGFRTIDVCSWGQQHLALEIGWPLSNSRREASFTALEDPKLPVPVFTPAASDQEKSCTHRLEPSRCIGLQSGGLAVFGTLCGSSAEAIEYFHPGAKQGVVHPLQSAPSAGSCHSSAFASWRDSVLLAGTCRAIDFGHTTGQLLSFSAADGVRALTVPNELEGVEKLVAQRDGALWLDAPPSSSMMRSSTPGAGLWRRELNGTWRRILLNLPMYQDRGRFRLAASTGLFGAAGDAWFDARYEHMPPDDTGLTWLFRAVRGTKPLTLPPEVPAKAKANTTPAREVPCMP